MLGSEYFWLNPFVWESLLCSPWTSIDWFDVLNELVNKFAMELNKDYTDDIQDIINIIDNFVPSTNNQDPNYLYPNGHRITHQMRWFKGSRDRGFKSDLAV